MCVTPRGWFPMMPQSVAFIPRSRFRRAERKSFSSEVNVLKLLLCRFSGAHVQEPHRWVAEAVSTVVMRSLTLRLSSAWTLPSARHDCQNRSGQSMSVYGTEQWISRADSPGQADSAAWSVVTYYNYSDYCDEVIFWVLDWMNSTSVVKK